MKRRIFNLFVVILAIFAVVFMGCPTPDDDDNTPAHTHQWGEWRVTTPAACTTGGVETRICAIDAAHKETRDTTALGHDWSEWTQITAPAYTTEGVETRTCTRDATHNETRAISRIPFTSVASFGTWLTSQPDNTTENPYTIALNVGDDEMFDRSNLNTILYNASNKYVYLDLSGSTITSIVDGLFAGCNGLTGVTIPNSVTSIGEFSFQDCHNLTDITIPDSVTSIGDSAFLKCARLASVTIPNRVISIGTDAFRESGLVSIIIPDSVTSIETRIFWGCRSLSNVIIGKNITSIPRLTFYNCDSFSSVTIPNSVINIERQAFLNCPKLTSVTFEGTIPSSGFSDSDTPSFFGDLRAKFYATDPTNGTPGTYITTAPVGSSSVWTKQ